MDLGERLRIQETMEAGRGELAISQFLALCGLRGFWPMSTFSALGGAYDQSGHGHHLTYNGNPTYNYDGIIPYIQFDGVGDYLSRLDEADLDILGTETYVAASRRGLTMGGWFYFDNAAAAVEIAAAKWLIAGNQRSYRINRSAAGLAEFYISSTGADAPTVTGTAITQATWTFLVGRFVPSTTLDVWVNGVKTTNAAAIPAAIFDGTADYRVGSNGAGAELMTGRASMDFLCALALSDATINFLFQQTRAMFGV